MKPEVALRCSIPSDLVSPGAFIAEALTLKETKNSRGGVWGGGEGLLETSGVSSGPHTSPSLSA